MPVVAILVFECPGSLFVAIGQVVLLLHQWHNQPLNTRELSECHLQNVLLYGGVGLRQETVQVVFHIGESLDAQADIRLLDR